MVNVTKMHLHGAPIRPPKCTNRNRRKYQNAPFKNLIMKFIYSILSNGTAALFQTTSPY